MTTTIEQALRIAVRQNEHDMLMTGEELRLCWAALAAHEAQPSQPLTDEQIDKLVMSRPAEGYALMCSDQCTGAEFRVIVRKWCRAIEAEVRGTK